MSGITELNAVSSWICLARDEGSVTSFLVQRVQEAQKRALHQPIYMKRRHPTRSGAGQVAGEIGSERRLALILAERVGDASRLAVVIMEKRARCDQVSVEIDAPEVCLVIVGDLEAHSTQGYRWLNLRREDGASGAEGRESGRDKRHPVATAAFGRRWEGGRASARAGKRQAHGSSSSALIHGWAKRRDLHPCSRSIPKATHDG